MVCLWINTTWPIPLLYLFSLCSSVPLPVCGHCHHPVSVTCMHWGHMDEKAASAEVEVTGWEGLFAFALQGFPITPWSMMKVPSLPVLLILLCFTFPPYYLLFSILISITWSLWACLCPSCWLKNPRDLEEFLACSWCLINRMDSAEDNLEEEMQRLCWW